MCQIPHLSEMLIRDDCSLEILWMKPDRHIQRDFENCHSRCHENSGTSYYWNIVLYLAANVLFLHEFHCSRQFVKISPSLVHIHMKNDFVVMGGNEAVRVAIISTLHGHVPWETAYGQCRFSLQPTYSFLSPNGFPLCFTLVVKTRRRK